MMVMVEPDTVALKIPQRLIAAATATAVAAVSPTTAATAPSGMMLNVPTVRVLIDPPVAPVITMVPVAWVSGVSEPLDRVTVPKSVPVGAASAVAGWAPE